MKHTIRYFSEGTSFRPENPIKIRKWLVKVASAEKQEIGNINYIFCTDRYLLKINQSYLRHHSLTDIITFQYNETGQPLEGDIFISIPRIRENAKKFKATFNDELHRVMVHGLLHLMGYTDKKTHDKAIMRKKETTYLSLR
ncbi:MAG: rRNA maturation RNase YbeY [Cyclobacteriaceae bacterium]|nr:rRNA maturation RNase YbeY [Cyclobacteriaceae bacterium]